ncbi:sodium:proton antiporter [Candidatus Omnitrophota bacterium]
MIYLLCFVLFMIGLYGVTTKKNLIKIVMGLVIMEYSVNLFLILIGYRKDGVAPIIDKSTNISEFLMYCVDPLPQAMVLTSIVISLGTLALMVGICIRLYERYGTFDITKMRKLKG